MTKTWATAYTRRWRPRYRTSLSPHPPIALIPRHGIGKPN